MLYKTVLLKSTIAGHEMIRFINSIDSDEVAQSEPPHQDLHCLPSVFLHSFSDIAYMFLI